MHIRRLSHQTDTVQHWFQILAIVFCKHMHKFIAHLKLDLYKITYTLGQFCRMLLVYCKCSWLNVPLCQQFSQYKQFTLGVSPSQGFCCQFEMNKTGACFEAKVRLPSSNMTAQTLIIFLSHATDVSVLKTESLMNIIVFE